MSENVGQGLENNPCEEFSSVIQQNIQNEHIGLLILHMTYSLLFFFLLHMPSGGAKKPEPVNCPVERYRHFVSQY